MSVIINKQSNFFFSSSITSGAQNVSSDGSQFSVTLNKAIEIPKSAVFCEIGVLQANIWNTSPNISSDFNNNIFKFTTNDTGNPGTHTINISEGLYSLALLHNYLSLQFENLGLPKDLILISGDDSSQKTVLEFKVAGDQVDFTVPNSIRNILGFNSRLSPLTPQAANYNDYSDTSAEFNRNNSYLIKSNIVSYGIPVNNIAPNIISQIPINVSPGSQINYQPQNVLWVDGSELIGNSRLNLDFELVNQSLQAAPTSGDIWSFVLSIRYGLLLTNQSLPLNPSN